MGHKAIIQCIQRTSTMTCTNTVLHAYISQRPYTVVVRLLKLCWPQRVMHAAVRLVASLGFHDPVTALMQALHWLPITYRIKYKLYLMRLLTARVQPIHH